MAESNLEAAFAHWLELLAPAAQVPEREYKFDEGRRWRFDFCWIDAKLAVELEGGTYQNGRHNRADGYAKDCEKYNAATLAGWRVLRYTSQMVESDPSLVIEQVCQALNVEFMEID